MFAIGGDETTVPAISLKRCKAYSLCLRMSQQPAWYGCIFQLFVEFLCVNYLHCINVYDSEFPNNWNN